jgi:quinol monooxygenase YgiN
MTEIARQQPGCVLFHPMVDLFDPETVFSVQAWESQQAFRRHFESDYHTAAVREIATMNTKPLERFLFNVASWERGPGADLHERLRALDSGTPITELHP